MEWFNPFGLVFMAVMMLPNVVFAMRCKDGFQTLWHAKKVELGEQIGRIGCFVFMVFNIPGTGAGFSSDKVFACYLLLNGFLLGCYCLVWLVCFRKNSVCKALALSLLPSCMFLCSGILSRSVLLTAAALLFAPCHILISYKNAVLQKNK